MRALQGDLHQMGVQMNFLERKGINVTVNGGIPLIESEEYSNSVKYIYSNSVEGWWNYRDYLISEGICTSEEFIRRLKLSMS